MASSILHASRVTCAAHSFVAPTLHQRIATASLPAQHKWVKQALRTWPAKRSAPTLSVMTKAGEDKPSFTQIPKAKTDEEAVTGALALAHDCEAAYGQAAEKVKDPELKKALEKFTGQATSQADQWRGLLNPPPDKETGFSSALNAGKVKLANLAGDSAIVKAIFNNSNDSLTAFREVSKREDFSKQTRQVASKLVPQAEEQLQFFEKWQAAN
ncbi:hypothetical protein WJX73_008396 [Symbiochloris irregularis]|uniref:Uncharacterized protein n=1 Tax=Symbiochloris irregularis TaxID=706552 RepID=A0AAW1PNQ4_9CHLO